MYGTMYLFSGTSGTYFFIAPCVIKTLMPFLMQCALWYCVVESSKTLQNLWLPWLLVMYFNNIIFTLAY